MQYIELLTVRSVRNEQCSQHRILLWYRIYNNSLVSYEERMKDALDWSLPVVCRTVYTYCYYVRYHYNVFLRWLSRQLSRCECAAKLSGNTCSSTSSSFEFDSSADILTCCIIYYFIIPVAICKYDFFFK